MYMNTAFDKVCFKGSVVSQSARFVYLCLCKHADNTKQTCFPSLNRIAQIVGKSISTIKRAVRELCCYGAIKREPRFRKDGGQTSNLYEIVECDFEKLIEIHSNKEVKKPKSIFHKMAERELQNHHITQDTTIDYTSFSVSDIQTENSCTVEGNEIKEIGENKLKTELQNQDITTETSAEDILLTVSEIKALNQFIDKEKDIIQKNNIAEKQNEIRDIIKEDESKSLHNKSENNSDNLINNQDNERDDAEHIDINEKEEHEEKKAKQEYIEARVYPKSQNRGNQIVNAELDDEHLKAKFKPLRVLSSKKLFAKMIKPISYIISAYKSHFSAKNELGGGHW